MSFHRLDDEHPGGADPAGFPTEFPDGDPGRYDLAPHGTSYDELDDRPTGVLPAVGYDSVDGGTAGRLPVEDFGDYAEDREDLIAVGLFRRLVHRVDQRAWELLIAPRLNEHREIELRVLDAVLDPKQTVPHLADARLVGMLAARRVLDGLVLESDSTTVWLASCGSSAVIAPAWSVGDGWDACLDCFRPRVPRPGRREHHPIAPLVPGRQHV